MKKITLRGKYTDRAAIVDDADYAGLLIYKWRGFKARSGLFYASTHIAGRTILMHRMIMGVADTSSPYVDHGDGNGLNNRRANLALVTQSQNMKNTQKHRAERAYWLDWIDRQLDKAHGTVKRTHLPNFAGHSAKPPCRDD